MSKFDERFITFLYVAAAPNCIAFLVWLSMIGPPPPVVFATLAIPALCLVQAVYFGWLAVRATRRDLGYLAIAAGLIGAAMFAFQWGCGAFPLMVMGIGLGVVLAFLVEARTAR